MAEVVGAIRTEDQLSNGTLSVNSLFTALFPGFLPYINITSSHAGLLFYPEDQRYTFFLNSCTYPPHYTVSGLRKRSSLWLVPRKLNISHISRVCRNLRRCFSDSCVCIAEGERPRFLLASLLGYPSTCMHNNALHSCTYTFTCWIVGGQLTKGTYIIRTFCGTVNKFNCVLILCSYHLLALTWLYFPDAALPH